MERRLRWVLEKGICEKTKVSVGLLQKTSQSWVYFILKYQRAAHLNNGAGNAWAGHSKVRLSLAAPVKLLLVNVVGNLGETLPTGSVN